MKAETLLIEIGTEELPPKALNRLSLAFKEGFETALQSHKLTYKECQVFATPRRLALLITQVAEKQDNYTQERRGPALKAALKDGEPTPALLGFARSCGVSIEELTLMETEKGTWYTFKEAIQGKSLDVLLPSMLDETLSKLPIPKRMHWSHYEFEFVRPVRWLVALWGEKLLPLERFGVKSDRITYGHRFHCDKPLVLNHANDYPTRLQNEGFVIANFTERKAKIVRLIDEAIDHHNQTHHQPHNQGQKETVTPLIDEALLNEVTALVEWPVALIGSFEAHFLQVPQEALIIAMQEHQRYFPLVDRGGKLTHYFCFISNLDSPKPNTIIDGNERVIRPRFADAEFFWEEDKKTPLEEYRHALESVIFQAKLGSQADKIRRVEALSQAIATHLGADKKIVARAAQLNKADLISNMVQEFPELQGTMARHYALAQGELLPVAHALEEVYWPRFSGDKLPQSLEAITLGLAERLDTIMGIFAIGEIPTGSRDPFSLRRNALAILRLLVENRLHLDLKTFIAESARLMPPSIEAEKSTALVFDYIIERMRGYMSELGIGGDIYNSVAPLDIADPFDIYNRLMAVKTFTTHPEASLLVEANKRIHNILERNREALINEGVEASALESSSEKILYSLINELSQKIKKSVEADDYAAILQTLASLAQPLENFFTETMVMTDDEVLRNNRLALLAETAALFHTVADISQLQL